MESKSALGEHIEIIPGLAFRERIAHQAGADLSVIQMRNVDYFNFTIDIPEPQLVSSGINPKQLLKPGDILLVAKGANNVAVVYQSERKAVVSNVFYILRSKNAEIDPEYLALSLNKGEASKALTKIKEGTSVTNISAKGLESILIQFPSLNKQKMVVSIYRMWTTEKEQTLRLLNLKEMYLNEILLSQVSAGKQPDPFTDDSNLWVGYELSSLYHMAHIHFKDSIFIKKMEKPVSEMVGIILKMERYKRVVPDGPNGTRGYMAVKEWKVILPYDLSVYNDPAIPQEQKNDEIINVIPHSLIESITMVDRFGNNIEPINQWKA